MLSLLKSIIISSLSLDESLNKSFNNSEFISHHNSGNHTYIVKENQFMNRNYTNEFYIHNNHLLIINSTNYNDLNESDKLSVDWRDQYKVSSVKNQRSCGSCWAFSSVGAVESAWAIKNNVLYNLSEQELVDCSSQDRGCEGGEMSLAFKFIMNNSLCSNLSYPYVATDSTCMINQCNPIVHISNYSDVEHNNENSLKNAVAIQPVSVAIQANKRSFQMYQSGIYSDLDCGFELDHGVLVVGYGYDEDFNMSYWIIKNSWSTEWGENGYIRIQKNINDTRGLCGIAMNPSYPII
jgi:C1A family cysteine protease